MPLELKFIFYNCVYIYIYISKKMVSFLLFYFFSFNIYMNYWQIDILIVSLYGVYCLLRVVGIYLWDFMHISRRKKTEDGCLPRVVGVLSFILWEFMQISRKKKIWRRETHRSRLSEGWTNTSNNHDVDVRNLKKWYNGIRWNWDIISF